MGLPEAVRIASAKLDPKMQKAFARDFAKRKKSLIGACVAWLFLGWHYLYLGKIGLQFAFLGCPPKIGPVEMGVSG
jgi:hypothetical protein